MSKSCWIYAINRPGVWTSHTGQTGCVTGFSPLRHSCAWTVCISADQNGASLIKMAREEIGLQPRSTVILRHAQQDFDTIDIFRGFSFHSIFRVPRKTSVIRVLMNLCQNTAFQLSTPTRVLITWNPRPHHVTKIPASHVMCFLMIWQLKQHSPVSVEGGVMFSNVHIVLIAVAHLLLYRFPFRELCR